MSATVTPAGGGRRWPAAVGLLALVVVVAVGLLAFRRDPPPPLPHRPAPATAATAPGGWTVLPRPPLSPRWGAVGGWTGRFVLVVGGSSGSPCVADCDRAAWRRDGAAYEPLSRTWTRLPDAPVPIGPGAIAATTGATLVVRTVGRRLLALDTPTGRWRTLPDPGFRVRALTGTSQALYAVGTRVAVLDAADSHWNALPRPPRPIGADTGATAYVGGLVLTEGDALERWDGRRWTRETLSRPGRVDAVTGAWQRLPAPPRGGAGWLDLPVSDGRPATTGGGRVWVPGERAWVPLGLPVARLNQPAVVYADQRIYLLGGLREAQTGGERIAVDRDAWVWSP